MIIILVYIIALAIQFFSPWPVQILMMIGNYFTPDFVPVADEVAQAFIFAKTIKSGYSKFKIGKKIYDSREYIKAVTINIIKIFSFIGIIALGLYFFNLEKHDNKVVRNSFYEKDVSKINISKENLYKFGVTEDWLNKNMMFDEANKKYMWSDIQILILIKKIVLEENNEKFLKLFSKEELAIIRNTIFAEKGFSFKVGGKYRNYFDGKSWYNPVVISENDIQINETEKRLINLIKKYENQ